MSYRTLKRVYLILAGGAFLFFFGHGAQAAFENSEKFRGLVSNSLNNVFGTSTSVNDWAISTAVRTIGWTDITISLVIVVFAIGVHRRHGALARFATSRFAIAIFAYGAFYAFVNPPFHAGLATAAGNFYPDVWGVVERGPNFLVPVALLYLTYITRRPAQIVQHEEEPAKGGSCRSPGQVAQWARTAALPGPLREGRSMSGHGRYQQQPPSPTGQ
jgi:hypothetical protein